MRTLAALVVVLTSTATLAVPTAAALPSADPQGPTLCRIFPFLPMCRLT